MSPDRIDRFPLIITYYAATVGFLMLDSGFDTNLTIAFLENQPVLRTLYYVVLFGCLAVVLRWPARSMLVSTVESAVVLAGLIINVGSRVVTASDVLWANGAAPLTLAEVINFLLAGGIGYLGWARGMHRLRGGPEP